MEQYILKSALVEEIDRLIKKNELYLDENVSDEVRFQKTGAYSVLCDLRHFLDTLEVKGVDLEKEAELIANGIMIGVQANRYHTVVYNTKRNDFNHSYLMLAARKGIELGLKIHKNEI